MRGADQKQGLMYSYVTMERRIREDHPERRIRGLVDRALERMDTLLDAMYASKGRPSIAPERLLRAQLLMVLYSIRSERQLMEQLAPELIGSHIVLALRQLAVELDYGALVTVEPKRTRMRVLPLREQSY